MLAKRVDALPGGAGWIFEPKWDGFRVLVFRDGDELLLQSRDEKPLDRYFPELRAPLLAQLPARCVLDGELVIAHGRRRSTSRRCSSASIRPRRASKLLAQEIPASVVFWDLLCEGERDLRARAVPRAPRASSSGCSRGAAAAAAPDARDRGPRASRPTGSAASRAPGSTA